MDEATTFDDIPETAGSGDDSSSQVAVATPEQAQPAAPQQQDVWSSFRSLPDFHGKPDSEIAGRLYASMQREQAATKALGQYQQLIPYAQEFLRYREDGSWDKFQRWLASPQPQQPQVRPDPRQEVRQEQKQGWWSPPAVKESSLRWMVKDENGREVIHPDAPLHVKDELYEYQKYRADFAQKFLSNPEEALGPMVEARAKAIASEIVQSQLQEVGEVGYVSNLEEENRDWLYNQDGTPTREGLMVQRYIAKAAELGLATPQQRWEYACDMVERDLLNEVREVEARRAQQAQFAAAHQQAPAPQAPAEVAAEPEAAPPPQNRDARDMNYLRREASRNPSRSTGAPDPRAPSGPLTFEQRLRAQMQRDGLS